MPDKSVREMSTTERKRHSLASRTFHAVYVAAALVGLVAMLVGLTLIASVLANRYIEQTFIISRNAATIVQKAADPAALKDKVMAIYREARAGQASDANSGSGSEANSASAANSSPAPDAAYYARFAALETDPDYVQIKDILADFRRSGDVNDLCFAVFDAETMSLVYIVDPDDSAETGTRIGYYEPVSEKKLTRFMNSDGKRRVHFIERSERQGWICTSGTPVYNADGSIAGFFLAYETLSGFANSMGSFLLQYLIIMLIVINILAFLQARRIKRKLVKPINEIADAAQAYARDRTQGITAPEQFAKLDIRTGDEIESLSLIMKDIERELAEYEEDLARISAEEERLGAELSLARRIQADMLPNIYPAFPDRPEFDIYATMNPAKEVGGDFYDFFLIDDNHLGMVIADVSGKGVPAALFMMVSKIVLQNTALTGRSPGEVLEIVNNHLCAKNREEMFVTVWFGVLEISTGTVTAANAGHEYPAIRHAGGEFELFKDSHGMVIGGVSKAKYKDYTMELKPGDMLFVYTDGVTEATDASGTLFGTDRMLEALNAADTYNPYHILDAVKAAVRDYEADVPKFDDMTMMCLQYNGPAGNNVKEITVDALIENLGKVTEFVDNELEALGCPPKTQQQFDLAIDELFSNIAHYAYGEETGLATIRLAVQDEPRAVTLTFIDCGSPFDPLSNDDPDITLSAEERGIGGLGIFLVKKTMDEVSYEYKNGENQLSIKKLL